MRKYLIYIKILFLSAIILSCEKELTTENISRITYYPVFEVKGDRWAQIDKGGSWSDPGVIGKEGTKEISVKVEGADKVDLKTPGVYTIKYSAVNKDGYAASTYRYVGVIDPVVKGKDISGNYKRTAGALGVSTVSKIKDNLFQANNVGGVEKPSDDVSVQFYYYAPGKIKAPYQFNGSGYFETKDEAIVEGEKYSWIVLNGGYGPALRTFVKQ
ncbi:MAG: DUF5011 domain-containing protein [Pseudarcicella sp.]|nr:DUF5011 domain-containing protein [Pseudarcicella sp.]MBP6410725.1 DUF5011 domain-containing protein [Pseudarcicella sp.]